MTIDEMMEKSDMQFRDVEKIAKESMEMCDRVITERDSLRELCGELLDKLKYEVTVEHEGCPEDDCEIKPLIKRAESILKGREHGK